MIRYFLAALIALAPITDAFAFGFFKPWNPVGFGCLTGTMCFYPKPQQNPKSKAKEEKKEEAPKQEEKKVDGPDAKAN